MDGADIHRAQIVRLASMVADLAHQIAQSLAELGGGLLGEGREVDLAGLDAVVGDQVDGPPQQHASLARARAGGQIQRAIDVEDGLALGGIRSKASCGPELFDVNHGNARIIHSLGKTGRQAEGHPDGKGQHPAHSGQLTNVSEIYNLYQGDAELILVALIKLFDNAFIRPMRRNTKPVTTEAKLSVAGELALKSAKT